MVKIYEEYDSDKHKDCVLFLDQASQLGYSVWSDETKEILRLLLDSYVAGDFINLKDVKHIFGQKEFVDLGYTHLKIIKTCFGTKEKYFDILVELENKLYE